jgi:hypothetical protein
VSAAHGQADNVSRLIRQLKDPNPEVRGNAAIALGLSKDPRAVEPLIVALKDRDAQVRLQAAHALGEVKDPRAVSALLAVLRDRDTEIISEPTLYIFFIERGEPGSEDALVETLDKFGDEGMAEKFLNSRNVKLEGAARAWAARHEVRILNVGGGSDSGQWGSKR